MMNDLGKSRDAYCICGHSEYQHPRVGKNLAQMAPGDFVTECRFPRCNCLEFSNIEPAPPPTEEVLARGIAHYHDNLREAYGAKSTIALCFSDMVGILSKDLERTHGPDTARRFLATYKKGWD